MPAAVRTVSKDAVNCPARSRTRNRKSAARSPGSIRRLRIVSEPALGLAKRRIGARLGSSATAGEGTQNLLCAYLAVAVFAGLAADTLLGAWWLDGVVALGIAGWAVFEGRRAWAGKSCGCASQPRACC